MSADAHRWSAYDELNGAARRAVRLLDDLDAVRRRRRAALRDGWDVEVYEQEATRLRDELTEVMQILVFA